MLSTTNTPFNPYEENVAKSLYNRQIQRESTSQPVSFPFYVRDRLPVHVLENYELYVKFIETYFEWLGTSNRINDIPFLMDISNISDDLLVHHKKLFANIFPENENLNWSDPSNSGTDVRRFLNFVREFYLTKGTEECYRFLISSLYDEDPRNIDFQYPKVRLCFLSDSIWIPNIDGFDTDAAGVTYAGYWKDSRNLLSDGVRLQGGYYQPFSYFVTRIEREADGGITYGTGGQEFRLTTIKEITHPAGYFVGNNRNFISAPEYFPDSIDTGYSEQPLIGHYLPYTFNTTLNPRQPFPDLCNLVDLFPCGFNPYEINPLEGTVNCFTTAHDSNDYPIGWTAGTPGVGGYAGPTYGIDTYNTAQSRGYTFWVVFNHPATWSVGPETGTAFGDLKIGWLVNLVPDAAKNYNTSPNNPEESISCSLA